MLYDRTILDVNSSKEIKKRGAPFSNEELQILERGTLTIKTLNRIEEKQKELKKIINNMGYYNTPIINRNWSYSEIFDEEELKRIVENNKVLRNSFFVFRDSPKDAVAKYHYNEINALEKILFDLEVMTEYVKGLYKECDTFFCGE